MPTRDEITSYRERLESIREGGQHYFAQADPQRVKERYGQHSWLDDRSEIQDRASALRTEIKRLAVDLAGTARGSPLIADADFQDLRHGTRQMLASFGFKVYLHFPTEVHHDEGVVLGVDPPSQREEALSNPKKAKTLFNEGAAKISNLIDFLSPAEAIQTTHTGSSTYQPNTAFIMMAIDSNRPELEDVKTAIKEVFAEFGIRAETADEKEHEGVIMDQILEEIETNEFLIADLTGERPNVYYEIGHAHARNKRVILYRKAGTRLHFDVAHRNCQEYENITALRNLLRRRLEALTNRPRRP